jgi:twitching motility protein PilT
MAEPAPLKRLALVNLVVPINPGRRMYLPVSAGHTFKELPPEYHADSDRLIASVAAAINDKTPDGAEIAIQHDGVRYRVNYITDHHEPAWIVRPIMSPIPDLSTISLTPDIHLGPLKTLPISTDDGSPANGLIIISGSPGSGKSTLAGSLMKSYLTDYGGIAITLQDPVEVDLPRHVGPHGMAFHHSIRDKDFNVPLAGLKRWMPRYALIGEIRDRPSALATIDAACIGILSMTTIHATSVSGALHTIQRQIDNNDGTALSSLAANILAIIHVTRIAAVRTDKPPQFVLEVVYATGSRATGIRATIRKGTIETLDEEAAREYKHLAMSIANGKNFHKE